MSAQPFYFYLLCCAFAYVFGRWFGIWHHAINPHAIGVSCASLYGLMQGTMITWYALNTLRMIYAPVPASQPMEIRVKSEDDRHEQRLRLGDMSPEQLQALANILKDKQRLVFSDGRRAGLRDPQTGMVRDELIARQYAYQVGDRVYLTERCRRLMRQIAPSPTGGDRPDDL